MQIMDKMLVVCEPGSIVPSYAYNGESVGLDLYARSVEYDKEIDAWIYKTGVHIALDKDEAGFVCPCSRNRKTDYYIPNTPGIVDPGFTGEVTVNYKNRTNKYILNILSKFMDAMNINYSHLSMFKPPYEIGECCGQLIIVPIVRKELEIVDKLPESYRGDKSHGSTSINK